MEQKRPRWVDKPEFEWTPEAPLGADAESPVLRARFSPANANPAPGRQKPGLARSLAFTTLGWIIARAWRLEKLFAGFGARLALPAIAPRLAAGLAQGLVLLILLHLRDTAFLPAGLTSGLIMAATFAPLLLIQGLGRIPASALAVWTGSAALGLAVLGAYHHWRIGGADAGHSGLWLAALTSVFLFIGQSLLLGHARGRREPLPYTAFYEASWRLAAEAGLCGALALAVWSVWMLGVQAFAPSGLHPLLSRLDIVAVTLSLALAAQLRPGPLLHLLKRAAVIFLAASLPLLIPAAAGILLFVFFGGWRPPFLLSFALAASLLLAINGSYRSGHEWRPQWRRHGEFIAAFLLLPLAGLAAMALHARTAEFGFTAPRVIALAATLVLAAYALAYMGTALISLGGGRWMERIETANLLMAFVVLSVTLLLASPLGDPARLAVAEQSWRAAHTAPERFDFGYLRQSGLRFGHAALDLMVHQTRDPALARGAFLALAAAPAGGAALPSEIGANIRVMTPGALLPSTLLARDWRDAGPVVPPCLLTARLSCDAYFVDLNRDGLHEIILAYGNDASWWAAVMRQTDRGWTLAGTIAPPPHSGTLAALRAGAFTLADPLPGWRELMVNGKQLAVSPIPHAAPAQGGPR